jgi:hypothetical protein
MHQITFQRTKDELLKTWSKRTLLRRAMLLRMLVVFGCAVFLWFCDGFWRYLGVAFALYVVYVPIGAIGVYSRILRTTPDLTAPMTVSFGDTGVVVQSTVQKTEIGWSIFSGWAETPDYFILSYRGTPIELVLPKRAFAAQQAEAFIGYLRLIGARKDGVTLSAV